jgi:hypothetical protein
MTLERLAVHFASEEQAVVLRADEALHVEELRPVRSEADLLDALATAMEFPDYFGANWDAVDECLRDLESDHPFVLLAPGSLWRQSPGLAARLVDSWTFAAAERDDLHLVFVWGR